MDIKKNEFEKLVSEAIDNIPEPYQSKIDGINFRVETAPTPEQRKKLGLRPCDALFGLYEGVPLPARGGAVHSIVPDIITIFTNPMTEMYTDDKSLRQQIFKTVWHEVAHYFGLNHHDIHKIESKIIPN